MYCVLVAGIISSASWASRCRVSICCHNIPCTPDAYLATSVKRMAQTYLTSATIFKIFSVDTFSIRLFYIFRFLIIILKFVIFFSHNFIFFQIFMVTDIVIALVFVNNSEKKCWCKSIIVYRNQFVKRRINEVLIDS